MRFLRTPFESLYESVRLQLDAAWGLPNAAGTATCFDPVSVAPRDNQGRVLLAVDDEFCQYAEVAAILPELLASGAVEEIDQATYMEAVSTTP